MKLTFEQVCQLYQVGESMFSRFLQHRPQGALLNPEEAEFTVRSARLHIPKNYVSQLFELNFLQLPYIDQSNIDLSVPHWIIELESGSIVFAVKTTDISTLQLVAV